MNRLTIEEVKAMSPEEQKLALCELLALGSKLAGLKPEDVESMFRFLEQEFGLERGPWAGVVLGVAVTIEVLTADGYRLLIGDRDLALCAIEDMAKLGEPIALQFLEG